MARLTCAHSNCGTFLMDDALVQRLKRTGDPFYCPGGHEQHFDGASPEAKLRERIAELEQEVTRLTERAKNTREQLFDTYDELRDERARRKHVEALYLAGQEGVVEITDDVYRWVCPCGASCRTDFETRGEAYGAYDDHRGRDACDETEQVVA
ncbi:hypothetical protein [Halomarina oriensis]|uniref:Uncharacterized protein n=1 Tax=Halomarina oriensis TaxID=671145 RepID=A0A6B0GP26_9EURY|nr:hypothetical protein [Halomarina oriensis]MWG36562.1 hypothetical protein [Halomarina oriensis]